MMAFIKFYLKETSFFGILRHLQLQTHKLIQSKVSLRIENKIKSKLKIK